MKKRKEFALLSFDKSKYWGDEFPSFHSIKSGCKTINIKKYYLLFWFDTLLKTFNYPPKLNPCKITHEKKVKLKALPSSNPSIGSSLPNKVTMHQKHHHYIKLQKLKSIKGRVKKGWAKAQPFRKKKLFLNPWELGLKSQFRRMVGRKVPPGEKRGGNKFPFL